MRPILVALSLLLTVAACGDDTTTANGVSCSKDTDCKLSAATGTCEASGFCSYPDASCAGGGRYTAGADGALSNTCIGGEVACGAQDQACCNDTVCGSDLACVGGTCKCGGDTEPCCGGDTCGTNFTCGADSTCGCGAGGEACCGGSTCDTGLACDGGTTCKATVSQVALGRGHICVLLSDKTVSCWGYDWKPYSSGTPGLNTTTIASSVPEHVFGLTDVVELRSGEMHSCAKKADNTLWCWGHNESGELGNGTKISSSTPVPVTGLTNVTQFSVGEFHTCAVGSSNGTAGLWCWGHNGRGGRRSPQSDLLLGRLGNNDIVDSATPVAVDLSVAAAAGQTVKAIAAGGYQTCAVMSDNTVWCWGDNRRGSLGNNTTVSTKAPVMVDFSQVTIPAGVSFDLVTLSSSQNNRASACAHLSNGTVYCWGNNDNGQLGTGDRAQQLRPTTPVVALATTTFTADIVSSSDGHCGRDSAGAVWCWGSGRKGQLGNNDVTESDTLAPVQAIGLTNIASVAMSHRTACAVDTTGQLFCWGNNRKSQITPGMIPATNLDAIKRQPVQVTF